MNKLRYLELIHTSNKLLKRYGKDIDLNVYYELLKIKKQLIDLDDSKELVQDIDFLLDNISVDDLECKHLVNASKFKERTNNLKRFLYIHYVGEFPIMWYFKVLILAFVLTGFLVPYMGYLLSFFSFALPVSCVVMGIIGVASEPSYASVSDTIEDTRMKLGYNSLFVELSKREQLDLLADFELGLVK